MIPVAALYAVGVAASLGLLALVGYPLARFCAGDATRPPVPSPVLGVAVLQLFAWYWATFTNLSFGVGMRTLVVVAAAGCALCWRQSGFPRPRSTWVLPVASAFGCVALVGLYFSSVLSMKTPTTFSGYNADAVSYVLHSQELADHGLKDRGKIAGQDFRDSLPRAFGAYAGLAALPALLGKSVWNFGGVFLLTAVFLGIYATGWLLRLLVPLRPLTAAVVAGLPTLSLLFAYVTSQYFLAQLLTMAALPVVAGLLLWSAEQQSLAARARLVLPLGLLLFGILATYGHMAFLAPPVLAAGAALSAPGTVRRSLRVGRSLAMGLLGAVVVAPPVTDTAIDVLRYLGSVDAGWPLSGFLPIDLLGFTRTVAPQPSPARWIWSFVVMLVFLGAAAVVWRRHRLLARFACSTVAFILLSYLVIYLREGGPTYRQWKWITLYEPILVSLILAVVVTALAMLPRRRVAVGALLVTYGAALVVVSRSEPGRNAYNWRPIKTATTRYRVSQQPFLKGLSEVNVSTFDKWDAMWLSYFLRDKTVYFLEPTYFAVSRPKAAWTVERVDNDDQSSASPRIDRSDAVILNHDFRLVAEDRSCPPSSEGRGLASELTVSVDGGRAVTALTVRGHVTAKNVGTACWVTSASKPGGVVLAVDLVDSDGVVQPGFFQTAVVPASMRPVRPGDSVRLDLSVSLPAPDGYVLKFRLKDGAGHRFGQELDIPIEVTAGG